MQSPYPPLAVRVWGELACFTRPEMKVERVSYSVPTPSAARGILEAICWKPECFWQVEEIWVLRPIRYFSILRNEVNSRANELAAVGWQAHGGGYDAAADRAQRHTLGLRDVDYLIFGQVLPRPGSDANPAKFRDQFRRRVRDGRCFATPYLGCREFSAAFGEPNGSERPIDRSEDLGLMLLDLDYATDGSGRGLPDSLRRVSTTGCYECPLGHCRAPRGGDLMLLKRLREYADERLDLPPTLYAESPVRYVVELNGSGKLLSRAPVDTADAASPRARFGEPRLVPAFQRTLAIRPLLLADNAEYTLGLARPSSRPERVAESHRRYLDLLARCAEATGEPAVEAVSRYLGTDPLAQFELGPGFDRGAKITFRVDGVFVVDLPAVQEFWAAEHDPGRASAQSPVLQCLICGEWRPVLSRLQARLKRVPGGQPSGTSLISASAEAFGSYGLEASLVAPTCATCGERFTQAANHLLADRASHVVAGGAAFVFWTREDVGFDLLALVNRPSPEVVREFLAAIASSQHVPEVDDIAFYATALSGNGGRAVVRDWISTTVGEVKQSLARWLNWQSICGPFGGDETWHFGIHALAASTVRDAAKELTPPTPCLLVHAALTGTPVPPGLLYQAVRQSRAEQTVTPQRAALIKLVLRSHESQDTEDMMVQLDGESLCPAYRCGRLLAVLEEVQKLAIPGINATIVDRYFGTASSSPASVFGPLLRGGQIHLAGFQRKRRGARVALQRHLEDVQAGLRRFPRTLTLEEQGLFALGYYHQRAFHRGQTIAASVRGKAGAATAASDDTETVAEGIPELAEQEVQTEEGG